MLRLYVIVLIFSLLLSFHSADALPEEVNIKKGYSTDGITFPSLTSVVTDSDGKISVQDEGKINVLFVSEEVIGVTRNGGIGTALTSLAFSLVKQGHAVTILFTKGTIAGYHDVYEQWVQYYKNQGIELIGLFQRWDTHFPTAIVESFEVTYFLKKRHFDIVHCHDYKGVCYFSMLNKHQGEQHLEKTSFILGLHGPTMWAKKTGNQEKIKDVGDLEVDFMEKKCLELADYVVR